MPEVVSKERLTKSEILSLTARKRFSEIERAKEAELTIALWNKVSETSYRER